MSIQSIVSKIVHGVVTVWDAAEADVDAAFNAIKSTLPASAQGALVADVAAVKQAASDALTFVSGAAGDAEKTLAASLEAALDAYLTTATNGAAVPLVPVVNTGIDSVGNLALGVVQSWLLSAKASLAANAPKPAA